VLRRIDRVERRLRHLDRQTATIRHGISRVYNQVQDDLLELAGVGLDATDPIAPHNCQIHVLTDEAPEHRLHSDCQLAQVYHPRLQDLLAAERQQLLRQPPGLQRRLPAD
jgi:hypothetical protein